MRKLLLVVAIALIYAGPVISAEPVDNANIVLDADGDSLAWQAGEIEELNHWLKSLPAQLTTGDAPIHLYKNHPALRQHTVLARSINIADYPRSDLHKAVLHALLHVYAERIDVAGNAQWRDISGWGGRLAPLLLSADNQDVRAYASRLGMQSPQEDFVTAAEEYFMPQDGPVEDSIKCRLAAKYAFIAALFTSYRSLFERAGVQCQTIDNGFLDDLKFVSPVSGELVEIGPVNENTVSGFELLYATPGTADAAEIAGHLLLRIKLNNNPDAERDGDQNPKDLVISFLADTEQPQSSNASKVEMPAICETGLFNTRDSESAGFVPMLRSVWQALKGLSGGFLTVMDRQTLGQTIKHYTLDEDRNLLRFALNLNPQQKKQLLDYLYQAKKNYKSEYYFFSNNCASVLVKIVANGIGAKEIAEFNPWVSPPNALVALFLRYHLAQPVYPSFYSFRQQGQIAQDATRAYYQSLLRDFPARSWPDISDVFQSNDDYRSAAIVRLREFSSHNHDIQSPLWRLSQLIHQADLTYSFRDQVCQQITPQSTAEIRRWQQTFDGQALHQENYAALQEARYQVRERSSFERGVAHTKLLSVNLAGSYNRSAGDDGMGYRLGAAFMRQDMGSMANIAMQRSSAVDLGSVDMGLLRDSGGELSLGDWRFNALSVRKFKQRLDSVPGFFSADGKLGVGLNVLKIQSDKQAELIHGGLLGAEALFNLYSSADNDDHAFASFGVELHRHAERGDDRLAVMAPLYVETLNSWLPNRRLQWRNHMEIRYGKPQQLDNEWQWQSRLGYRLAGKSSMALLFVSAERWHWSDQVADKSYLSVGVEWDRF